MAKIFSNPQTLTDFRMEFYGKYGTPLFKNVVTLSKNTSATNILFLAVYPMGNSGTNAKIGLAVVRQGNPNTNIVFVRNETNLTTGTSSNYNHTTAIRLSATNHVTNVSGSSYRSIIGMSGDDITKANLTLDLVNVSSIEIDVKNNSSAYPPEISLTMSANVPVVFLNSSEYGNNTMTVVTNGEYYNSSLIMPQNYDSGDGAQWLSAYTGGYATFNYYSWYNLAKLLALANGNLDANIDTPLPFEPLPTDFYITVNAYSNHADSGQQTIDFSWMPQNAEELEIDLSNVDLHFDFFMTGGYDWKTSVKYSENGFSTSYKTLLENLEIPWYRNVLNKLPLPSQETNTTISVSIWWSDTTGNAGKCRYEIKYNGANSITVDKMQDETSGYWTYITADDNDPNQPYDDDPNPYDDLSNFGGGTDAVNGSALLTTSYALSVSGAHDFGNWLWGTGLDLNQLKMVVNNPIENIVSCKLFPFSLTGTASTVKLGNLTSPVNAYLLPENVARTFDMGTVTVHRQYNSFLDYAPYTTVRIYLPYLGLHELDTNTVMGQAIRVKYYVDLVTGHCRAIVFLDGAQLKKVQQIDGMIGQDVPVVGSNRAQVEAGYIVGGAQAVANFVGGIGSAIMGNIGSGLSDIGNAVKGGLQTAMQQYHTYTSGTPSPALSRFDEQKICVFVNRPVYTEPFKFGHQNGKMCNLTCKLGTLSGYTVIDNTVDLSSIPCNKEERDELLKLLTSGIYL